MNVREDKMTNHWGLQIGKPSLTCCVPVLLIVSRRLKHENILLDVVKWVLSKSIKERGLFYHFWSISRYNLNEDFMFLENESKLCESRVNLFFWRISLRQPVCSYTPIIIIRMILWARNVGTWDFYISIAMFCDYCFLSIFDASINFMRCFPLIIKNKER